MSRISKMLGSMWTTLTREEKKVVQQTISLLSLTFSSFLSSTVENAGETGISKLLEFDSLSTVAVLVTI